MRISDWSSDVCSSDLWHLMGEIRWLFLGRHQQGHRQPRHAQPDPTQLATQDDTPSLTGIGGRSEEHTSELQSLMRNSYAVFCLKKKKNKQRISQHNTTKPKQIIQEHKTHHNNY